MQLSTQVFFSCLTSSQLFFCLSVRCYLCRFRICACRAWRTSVSLKGMFQVSCIIFLIVLHFLLIYYLLFSFIDEILFVCEMCSTIFIHALFFFFVDSFSILLYSRKYFCLFIVSNVWEFQPIVYNRTRG